MQRELTPTQQVSALTQRVSTPTQRGKGSQGELNREYLKGKERRAQEEYDLDEYGRKVPMHESTSSHRDEYHDKEALKNDSLALESGAVGAAAGALMASMHQDADQQSQSYEDEGDYYEHEEDIPSPLARYVPYNQQKRGLSPIQSVSGYTEDDGAGQQARDSRLTRSTGSYSTMNQSPQHQKSAVSEASDLSPQRENHHDFKEVRQGGLADSEITQDHDDYWDEQHMENNRNRGFDEDSYRSSDPRIDYNRMTNYTDDSLDGTFRDRVSAGQSVRGLGANPDYENMTSPQTWTMQAQTANMPASKTALRNTPSMNSMIKDTKSPCRDIKLRKMLLLLQLLPVDIKTWHPHSMKNIRGMPVHRFKSHSRTELQTLSQDRHVTVLTG
jgi:hypothetical protein